MMNRFLLGIIIAIIVALAVIALQFINGNDDKMEIEDSHRLIAKEKPAGSSFFVYS